jgi:hypothetical protein
LRALLTSCAAAFVVFATTTAAASSIAPPDADAAAREHIDAIVVDARIPAHVAMQDALRVRITDRPVSDSAHARSPKKDELFAYLEIESATPERVSVRLLLSDGRAYVRAIDAPESTRAREVAATIANLLAGIEEGAIAPTQEHVQLPVALRPVAPVPKKPATPPPVRLRPEWGLVLGGAAIFGVGPPPPQGLAAGGGELRGEARWPRGPTLGLAVRLAGRRNLGYGLVRVRVAPSFGWAWRRGNFELHTIAMVTVEPWSLLHGGDAPVVDRRPVSALLGGALRLEPVGRVPLARGKSLRIGPFVEVAGSAIPSRTGGVARLRRRDDAGELDDLFRAGGLEIAAGLVIGPWMPVR